MRWFSRDPKGSASAPRSPGGSRLNKHFPLSAIVFDWLFEGHLSAYFLLAATAALFIVLGIRTRKRRWYAVAAGVVALAGLYCLLDFAVETDREQIQRKVRAMAADLKAPAHLDAVMENVSDRFHCPFADSKKALREKSARSNPDVQHHGCSDMGLALRRNLPRTQQGRRRVSCESHWHV